MKMKREISYRLAPGPDGSLVFEPFEEDEALTPTAEDDGRYYLQSGDDASLLAWALFERGIEVHCAACRARLRISRAHILCPTDGGHFNVIAQREPS
jgi:hypothetical protein